MSNDWNYDCFKHKVEGMWPFMQEGETETFYRNINDIKDLQNNFLLEAALYEDNHVHLFLTRTFAPFLSPLKNFSFFPRQFYRPTKVSFSFVYDNNPEYKQIAEPTLKYYKDLKFDFETEVVCYDKETMEEFDMARARNRSLELCNGDCVFMLDLDVLIDPDQIYNIVHKYYNIKHFGVFNLKNDFRDGNGLWFGSREILLKNKYSEKFKKFYFEDTEFFANFSRLGIIPVVVFCGYHYIPHSRTYTTQFYNFNYNLFDNIFNGRVLR